ncbi:uncharacterized protein LOC131536098 isoform X3 [Onychostoma macrolepis]|uniref:uncharacterized protein LOC131536098 isoform X3 n=1 Tax=Onychostoma macrolepis TaxID=369639 RepID=UPI002729A6C0|nr:uncharacterized protein LOC131536098 isoform X3 [Onychostoma macrolepis]
MFVKVQFKDSKKFIKLQNGFTYTDFINVVRSRFDLQTGADLRMYDESHIEIDQDILEELLEANPKSTQIIKDHSEEEAASSCTDTLTSHSFSEQDVPSERRSKRLKTSQQDDRVGAAEEQRSAKEMVLAALKEKSKGDEIREEYKATNTLSNEMRRALVNILVGHMTERQLQGRIPTQKQREHYALGIVNLFPSLKDPFSKKGYEHFYDAASGSANLAWCLKTVQRNNSRHTESKNKPNSEQGGPNIRRDISLEHQLEGDALVEAISLLAHTGVEETIFEKMRQTFHQELVHNADMATNILKTFPRFLDTKGLVNQDFVLLFDLDTSSKLLERWDGTFKPKIIQEARNLTKTSPEQRLLMSAEKTPENAKDSYWDSNLSTLLLLVHPLPPSAGRKMAAKISASDAVEKLVVFQKKPPNKCQLGT